MSAQHNWELSYDEEWDNARVECSECAAYFYIYPKGGIFVYTIEYLVSELLDMYEIDPDCHIELMKRCIT